MAQRTSMRWTSSISLAAIGLIIYVFVFIVGFILLPHNGRNDNPQHTSNNQGAPNQWNTANPTSHQVSMATTTTKQGIIAICVAVKSMPNWTDVKHTYLDRVLLPSIEKTVTRKERASWDVHLHIGIDDNDEIMRILFPKIPKPAWLQTFFGIYERTGRIPFNEIIYNAAFPPKQQQQQQQYNGAAAAAAAAAVDQYFVRVNDDTEFLTSSWITKGVEALRSFHPPNVGVVGPVCEEGKTDILTHDMVHRTHLEIFHGAYYPVVFSNWHVDEWITKVYQHQEQQQEQQQDSIRKNDNRKDDDDRMRQLEDWRVKHHLSIGRYRHDEFEPFLVNEQVEKGKQQLKAYLEIHSFANRTKGNIKNEN